MEIASFLRFLSFLLVFVVLAGLEQILPWRAQIHSRGERWPSNLGLVLLNSILLLILGPLSVVGAALYAERAEWGLFNWWQQPPWIEVALSLIGLDVLVYCQHLAFHKIPMLWKVHRVHHVDTEVDLTTGLRFHPIEIILSAILKASFVLLIGVSPIVVLIFELILNGAAMFNHSNIKLPDYLDKVLRVLIVTPAMHRIHHSILPDETDSNFGFNISCWDRLFRTYRPISRYGSEDIKIGLREQYGKPFIKLRGLLLLPFKE